ncbi:hypothetical protein Tco_1287081 [Tanacetum coccineum]
MLKRFLRECHVCQRFKTDSMKPAGLLTLQYSEQSIGSRICHLYLEGTTVHRIPIAGEFVLILLLGLHGYSIAVREVGECCFWESTVQYLVHNTKKMPFRSYRLGLEFEKGWIWSSLKLQSIGRLHVATRESNKLRLSILWSLTDYCEKVGAVALSGSILPLGHLSQCSSCQFAKNEVLDGYRLHMPATIDVSVLPWVSLRTDLHLG